MDSPITIQVMRLPHALHAALPEAASADAAGLDLCAAIAEPVTLAPGARHLIPTGIAIALPPGCEAQVRPRSGLALRHGVTVLNAPGTVDADYRGEVGVILINHGEDTFTVEPGMRVAQMVVARYLRVAWDAVESLPESGRGVGGFGSTGG